MNKLMFYGIRFVPIMFFALASAPFIRLHSEWTLAWFVSLLYLSGVWWRDIKSGKGH